MWRARSGFTLLKCAAGSRLRPDKFSRCGDAAPSLGRYLSATVNVGRSENGGDANTMSCEEAKRLMTLVNVEAVKEKLGREEKEVIPYDATYQDLLKRLFLSWQRKLIKRHNFDVQRFVELQKQYKLLPYSCASIKR